jgi:hypothetical protein
MSSSTGPTSSRTSPRVHPQDVTVENLGDVTVLPGLVDGHPHLTWDCSPEPAAWHRGNADDALLERASLRSASLSRYDLPDFAFVTCSASDHAAEHPVRTTRRAPWLSIDNPPAQYRWIVSYAAWRSYHWRPHVVWSE